MRREVNQPKKFDRQPAAIGPRQFVVEILPDARDDRENVAPFGLSTIPEPRYESR